MERGEPVPEHLFAPLLLPGADEFLAAFWELSTDRQYGMSAGPIPSRSIAEWAARACFDADEQALFRRAIRAMDRVFLRHFDKSGRPQEHAERKPKVSKRSLTFELFDALFAEPKG